MCVGFTKGYSDFKPANVADALDALIPGSAVSFDRIGFFHFAIFLGWAWPKGGDSEPIPLLCHLSGDMNSKPRASVRLSDLRDVVQNSTVRVYKCSCSASKRTEVINGCLWRVGNMGYNLVTNNCEHFVREVINGEGVSYQTLLTMTLPIVQLPRLVVGSALQRTICASASSSCDSSKMDDYRSLGLINPEMDLIEIFVSNSGLNLKGLKKNSCCTNEFASGTGHFPMQRLFFCRSCSIGGQHGVCISCLQLCHKACETWGGRVCEDACSCAHNKRTTGLSPMSPIKQRVHGEKSPRIFEPSFAPDS